MSQPKVLSIIPARGGSKGLPGKNIKQLGDKCLIGWTIEASLNCNSITRTIVSTDCSEISKAAKKYGADVPFLRPSELGTDISTTTDVALHAINALDEKYEYLVILQPTSPFRTEHDIQKAFDIFYLKKPSSVVSVCEADKSPYWYFWRNDDETIMPVLNKEGQFSRRQDLEKSYVLNGAIYIIDITKFKDTKKFIYNDSCSYVMDKESSIDIDDLIDFKMAQLILGVK